MSSHFENGSPQDGPDNRIVVTHRNSRRWGWLTAAAAAILVAVGVLYFTGPWRPGAMPAAEQATGPERTVTQPSVPNATGREERR